VTTKIDVRDHVKWQILVFGVDGMLSYGTCNKQIKEFEELLQWRFNLELMGQAHLYLMATRINQLSNYNVELDQSRYCLSIFEK
jgi:hypothetical protein